MWAGLTTWSRRYVVFLASTTRSERDDAKSLMRRGRSPSRSLHRANRGLVRRRGQDIAMSGLDDTCGGSSQLVVGTAPWLLSATVDRINRHTRASDGIKAVVVPEPLDPASAHIIIDGDARPADDAADAILDQRGSRSRGSAVATAADPVRPELGTPGTGSAHTGRFRTAV